jgi:Arc/MetJ-type ribon-helix-helix transcriptional regulator
MTFALKLEQERMIQKRLAIGLFKSVDEVLTTALSQLPRVHRSNRTAVERMIRLSKENSAKLPPGETVENLVGEGHRY